MRPPCSSVCSPQPISQPSVSRAGVHPFLQYLFSISGIPSGPPHDPVAHMCGFCPTRYSFNAQDHYQRQRILQKERAIVSAGGLGSWGWGVHSPSITSGSLGLAALHAALLRGFAQSMVSWVTMQGGSSVQEVLLTKRAQRCRVPPSHLTGCCILARRRSGELCSLARSPAG